MNLIRIFKGEKKPTRKEDRPEVRYCMALRAWANAGRRGPEPNHEDFFKSIQKTEGLSQHVEFGPNSNNSAHALRLSGQPGVSTCHPTRELSAEHAHALAVQQWLDGGGIGRRPELSDFTSNRRSIAQKTEALGQKVNSFINNLFQSGI